MFRIENLESLNSVLNGVLLPVILIGVGVFLTIRLGFIQVRGFGSFFCFFHLKRRLINQEKKKSFGVFESVSTALASTIGTGSIVGIGAAIKMGGPGAVFWMWVSAFLGMATKYTEIVLAMHYRQKNSKGFYVGGPMYYLLHGLGSKILALSFSVFCILACFCMGNTVQANAISEALYQRYDLNKYVCAVLLMVLVGAVILGGVSRIGSFGAKLVPLMSVIYIGCCVAILVLNANKIPEVFRSIVREAFSPPAAIGGTSSFGIFLAMKNGFSKGIFSNEAGLGSAPIAHASSDDENFKKQGVWGMLEVFFTTGVICTLTALVVLCANPSELVFSNASTLSCDAFETALPRIGGFCVCISTVLFSFSSIIGWAFYGEICFDFLTKGKRAWIQIYRFLFVLAVCFGAIGNVEIIWSFSEVVNALMALVNLIGVVLLSSKVVNLKNKM